VEEALILGGGCEKENENEAYFRGSSLHINADDHCPYFPSILR
jgi:hypothetical protein